MASDKGKKKGKKGRDEPRNWSKIALQLFIVFIMVLSVFAFTLNHGSNSGSNSDTSGGIKFDGIADGLKLIPADASYARYVDLKNDSVLADSVDEYYWLFGALPNKAVFDVDPQRDLFAVYPPDYFGSFPEQFVSLTDFGTAKINQSYPESTTRGVKRVNSKYYYTYETKPVVSGRIENVVPTANTMLGGGANSYGNYSGIFDEIRYKQIPVNGMTLEFVGKSCNLSYVDRYYAGIGPADRSNTSANRLYNYTIVMHLNQAPPDRDIVGMALLESSMENMSFKSYRTQTYDDYFIIEAQGGLVDCINDMTDQWGFVKYQASL